MSADERPSPAHAAGGRPPGPPSGLTCPEGHGPLWESQHGRLVRYRCRVGHVFGQDVLVDGKTAAVESAPWMAVEALEERTELLERSRPGSPARVASTLPTGRASVRVRPPGNGAGAS